MDINVHVQKLNAIGNIENAIILAIIVLIAIAKIVKINHLLIPIVISAQLIVIQK